MGTEEQPSFTLCIEKQRKMSERERKRKRQTESQKERDRENGERQGQKNYEMPERKLEKWRRAEGLPWF